MALQAAAIIAAAATATAEYSSGKAQQYEYQRKARQEKLQARDIEIERKGRLLKALASRNVQAGVSGAALEGTTQSLVMSDSRQNALESLSSEANVASTVSGLKAAGTSAKRIGTINAAGTLIKAASSMYSGSQYGGKGK